MGNTKTRYLKSGWSLLDKDIVGFMNKFHDNAKFSKAFAIIAHVPKKDMPQKITDYRPISPAGSLTRFWLWCWLLD